MAMMAMVTMATVHLVAMEVTEADPEVAEVQAMAVLPHHLQRGRSLLWPVISADDES
jgi:hypothetical protein